MQNVVVHGIARPQHSVGKHVWMRTAPLAGNGVHGFDKFRAQVVQHLAHQADRLVFAHSRLHRAVRSEEHTSELQSRRDLVCRLLLEKKKSATLRPTLLMSRLLHRRREATTPSSTLA